MVVMPIIPASLEVIRRITVQGHLGQKARETPSQPTNGMWWCALVIPAIREVVGRRVTVWATWANTWDPTWKTTKTIKDCEAWLKWQSACLARARPRVQIQNKEGREGEKKQSWGSLIKVPNKVCGQSKKKNLLILCRHLQWQCDLGYHCNTVTVSYKSPK
jgi:hypothetical protein